MKRYIKSTSEFQVGDVVTVKHSYGYAPTEDTIVELFTNNYNVPCARLSSGESKALSSLIKSRKSDLSELTRDDVLRPEYIATMQQGDSIWCDRIRISRQDSDSSIENLVGIDAYIGCIKPNKFRVVITEYVSKNHNVTRDVTEEYVTSDHVIVQEAIDILSDAKEIYFNYDGYQRKL